MRTKEEAVKEITEKLATFFKANNLEFTEGRRNSDAVIACGYLDYLNMFSYEVEFMEYLTYDEVKSIFWNAFVQVYDRSIWTPGLEEEVHKVLDYTYDHQYGNWWRCDGAKRTYIF